MQDADHGRHAAHRDLSADLDRCLEFYRALGFAVRRLDDGPPRYAYLGLGAVRIGALESEPVDTTARHIPLGTEIVLVDEVAAARDAAIAAGLDLAADLQRRPWGLTDFRLHDPGGYYLRITDRDSTA